MALSISFHQLANLGIHAPLGATSFHTAKGEIGYLIGDTGQFERRALAPDAAERLKTRYHIGGTLGWALTGAGHAVPA